MPVQKDPQSGSVVMKVLNSFKHLTGKIVFCLITWGIQKVRGFILRKVLIGSSIGYSPSMP